MNEQKQILLDKIEDLKKEVEKIDSKERFRAENDRFYYFVYSSGDVSSEREVSESKDDFRYASKNYFETRKEAENHLKLLEAKNELQDHVDMFDEPEEDEEMYYVNKGKWETHNEATYDNDVSDKIMFQSGIFISKNSTGKDREKRLELLNNINNLTK